MYYCHETAYNALWSFISIDNYWGQPTLHELFPDAFFFLYLAVVVPYSGYTAYTQRKHHSNT